MPNPNPFTWGSGERSRAEIEQWLYGYLGVGQDDILGITVMEHAFPEMDVCGVFFLTDAKPTASLEDRFGKVDVWFEGNLTYDRHASVLPPWMDFGSGIFMAARRSLNSAAEDCCKTLAHWLDDILVDHFFRELMAASQDSIWRIVREWRNRMREIAIHSPGIVARLPDLMREIGEDMEIFGYNAKYYTDAKIAVRPSAFLKKDEQVSELRTGEIMVSIGVDPKLPPYDELFKRLRQKVFHARDPSVFMVLKQLARSTGRKIVRIDTENLLSQLGLHPVQNSGIEAALKAPEPLSARRFVIYRLGAAFAPAVYLGAHDISDSSDKLRRDDYMQRTVSPKGAAWLELEKLKDGLPEPLTHKNIIVNLDHQLISAFQGFLPQGTAGKIGVRHLEYIAFINSTKDAPQGEQDKAWEEMAESLRKVDQLEREEIKLKATVAEANQKIESFRNKLKRQRQSHNRSLTSLQEAKRKDRKQLLEAQEVLAKTQRRLRTTERELSEVRKELDSTLPQFAAPIFVNNEERPGDMPRP